MISQYFSASIVVRAGLVVDGIKIQDEQFGLSVQETSNNRIDLNPGETVESIMYGRNSGSQKYYRGLPCGFSFLTNTRKIGPYSWSNPCPPIYRVDIPSEKPLGLFFKENAIFRGNWFNGFSSENRTETEN